MKDDEGFEHDLHRNYNGPERSNALRTMTFGSRKRGDKALQTSCTAPSSDQVAAMIGSRYCAKDRQCRCV